MPCAGCVPCLGSDLADVTASAPADLRTCPVPEPGGPCVGAGRCHVQDGERRRVSVLPPHVLGAREMYCRNVYLRTGLTMPDDGWVVDLGANRGLFSVWAAVSGARAVAVEAQQGFVPLIEALAEHNGVRDRVHVEVAMVGGTRAWDPGWAFYPMISDGRPPRTAHLTGQPTFLYPN